MAATENVEADAGTSNGPGTGISADGGNAGSKNGVEPNAGSGGERADAVPVPVSSGGGGSIDVAADCDPTHEPLDQACIHEDHAVFVWDFNPFFDPIQGHDAFDGTRDMPVATLNRAVELAVESGKGLVLVCGVTEGLHLDGLATDLRLVGGFSCPDEFPPWSPVDRRVLLSAVEVRNSSGSLLLENFVIADRPYGPQRIGAIFENADLVLRNVSIEAGPGSESGVVWPDDDVRFSEPEALAGSDLHGDPGCNITCWDGSSSSGGRGEQRNPSMPAAPGLPDLGAGAPGQTDLNGYPCDEAVPGSRGADGAQGLPGLGAATLGKIVDGVFVGTPGTVGQTGTVGQGGGGSGATATRDGLPGACGGCPGPGGAAGLAGGSSIAILSLDSNLRIEASELITGDGAPGSPGGESITQPGGLASRNDPGCGAGDGGDGGAGGPGGGGAGGLSVGVLFTGTVPELIETTVTVGGAGTGGAGLMDNNGIDGIAAEIHELTEDDQVVRVERCEGTPVACEDIDTTNACIFASGCDTAAFCQSRCRLLNNATDCEDTIGCAWSNELCRESGLSCSGFDQKDACDPTPGCRWRVCSGTPTPCERIPADSCGRTPGCTIEETTL